MSMGPKIESLFGNWQQRGILGLYCRDKKEALDQALSLIPKGASVGFSGSVTLDELGLVRSLKERGNPVFDQYKEGLSQEESLSVRRDSVQADYYLASANGVAQSGELVFFSAFGNRIAGISLAKNVIIFCGINKITPTLEDAIRRSREYATPLNCRRLKNWNTACLPDGKCHNEICRLPEYRRMCCQVLVIEAEALPPRLKVVLIGEELGF